jgi:flagellar biosynthesis/type III secretory pathway M-ring protein FliF/YscJ
MKVEQYLTDKVQSLLDGVLGQGNAEVRVNAELDFTQSEKTITDYDPDRAVPSSQQIIAQSDRNSDSVAYTQANKDRVVTYPNSSREVSNSNEINNYEISSRVERIISEVGDLKRLSVAVLIKGTIKPKPNSSGGEFEYIPRPEEEINKLTQVVKNAVGFDSTRNDQVSVINVPFDTSIQETIQSPVEETAWWKEPDNIKLILLVAVMLSAILLMYRLLQSRQVKERMRIAMSLPEHVKIEDDDDDEPEEELEEIDFGSDDLLLLPAELPEQLLLEGDSSASSGSESFELDTGSSNTFDKNSLAEKAKADLDANDVNSLNEDTFLRLEIKGKVQDYVDAQTNEAVRLVRILLAQDFDEKMLKF